MESVFIAIKETPLTTILILAGLLFLLLGFVTKLGGFIEVAPEQKRWAIPTGLMILTLGLVLYLRTPTSSPIASPTANSATPSPTAAPASLASNSVIPSPIAASASASTAVASRPETTMISDSPSNSYSNSSNSYSNSDLHSNPLTSTYQESCGNISISENRLSADCRSENGELVQSTLELRGIDNINGVLTMTGFDYPSSYQESCDNISISGYRLSAVCRTNEGSQNQTAISLKGIHNINGMLGYK